MRGLRFAKKPYRVGAKPKQRLAVERIVSFARGLYETVPTVATLAVYVEAQQRFSDEIDEKLNELGLAEEYLQQVQSDLDAWTTRLSHYRAWVEAAIEGKLTFWVTETGEVVGEGNPDAALEMDAPDFLDLYLAQPLLYGNAYTIPSAEYQADKGPEGFSRWPDIGTGFSLVNQINAVGNVFDDASLLERRFGIWLEIAAQIKQSEWAQNYADDLQIVMDGASQALDETTDFIENLAAKGGLLLAGAIALGVVAYGYAKGSS